ncbi:MAG: crcB, partial [Sediminibacterium sp.]|nr:crcB [Sediminibacterium sp.]
IAAKQEGFANWRLFLATGICGGFTTFSAFAWENMQLLNQDRYGAFLLYVGCSLVLGLGAVVLGYWITK